MQNQMMHRAMVLALTRGPNRVDLGGFGVVGVSPSVPWTVSLGLLRLRGRERGGFEAFDDAAGVIVLADGLRKRTD